MTWQKYTWTNIYRDYILPTNNGSKNPLIAKIWFKKKVAKLMLKNYKEIDSNLKTKLAFSKTFFGIHSCWLGLSTLLIATSNKILINDILIAVLLHAYPCLVQIDIHQRINKILKKRSRLS